MEFFIRPYGLTNREDCLYELKRAKTLGRDMHCVLYKITTQYNVDSWYLEISLQNIDRILNKNMRMNDIVMTIDGKIPTYKSVACSLATTISPYKTIDSLRIGSLPIILVDKNLVTYIN